MVLGDWIICSHLSMNFKPQRFQVINFFYFSTKYFLAWFLTICCYFYGLHYKPILVIFEHPLFALLANQCLQCILLIVDSKREILANLANFAYDPINYEYFRQLNILDMFLGIVAVHIYIVCFIIVQPVPWAYQTWSHSKSSKCLVRILNIKILLNTSSMCGSVN